MGYSPGKNNSNRNRPPTKNDEGRFSEDHYYCHYYSKYHYKSYSIISRVTEREEEEEEKEERECEIAK